MKNNELHIAIQFRSSLKTHPRWATIFYALFLAQTAMLVAENAFALDFVDETCDCVLHADQKQDVTSNMESDGLESLKLFALLSSTDFISASPTGLWTGFKRWFRVNKAYLFIFSGLSPPLLLLFYLLFNQHNRINKGYSYEESLQ